MNWACEKTYKEFHNKKKKMCWCHTGVWDFGHTGITITEAKSVYHENVTENIFLANLFV